MPEHEANGAAVQSALSSEERAALAADAARVEMPERHPVRTEWQVAGGVVSGLRWGAPHEPEYVMLHGGGLHAHTWNAVLLVLGRPALALDLPGHGDSSWRADFDYAPATLGRTLAAVLAGLPRPVTLVGHSLGGMSGIVATALAPGIVRRLVLVDVSPSVAETNPGRQNVRSFMRGPESYGSVDEIIERARDFGITGSEERLRRGILLNTRRRSDGRVIFKHHLASPPPDKEFGYDPEQCWPLLEGLSMPVTLVLGQTGIVEARELAGFRQRMPHADVHILPAGHTVQRDAPRELAELLRSLSSSD